MLATLPLANGRQQTVKFRIEPGQHGDYHILRIQSRVCVATDAVAVRTALQANVTADWGHLALDLDADPSVIDVVYTFLLKDVSESKIAALFRAILRVAAFADGCERQVTDADVF